MAALSLAPRALYEEVAELLRQRIFNRELEPGSWIDELKIAAGLRHQPHAHARSAQGAGDRRAGDHESAPRRLCDRGLRARPGRCLPPAEPARVGCRGRRGAKSHRCPNGELQALHQELEDAANPNRWTGERFFEINERFHMRLLEIADNRWRNQMVADLRKVMKLNRHNSLLKSGRIQESLDEHRAIMAALWRARCPAVHPAHAGAFRKWPGSRRLKNRMPECRPHLMQQALALAAQSLLITSPNPRVGCVITTPDGQVLGQGYTQRAGEAHAEIMALRDAACPWPQRGGRHRLCHAGTLLAPGPHRAVLRCPGGGRHQTSGRRHRRPQPPGHRPGFCKAARRRH